MVEQLDGGDDAVDASAESMRVDEGACPANRCEPGDWVEVGRVLLEPEDRADGLPDDTSLLPLRVWVRGFARHAADLGDECEVETMAGRTVSGRLTAVNPGYTHTFGTPPPGIAAIGADVRRRVAEYRARESGPTRGDTR